eukprot:6205322-Pleurochrysis_carterae.AAC.3
MFPRARVRPDVGHDHGGDDWEHALTAVPSDGGQPDAGVGPLHAQGDSAHVLEPRRGRRVGDPRRAVDRHATGLRRGVERPGHQLDQAERDHQSSQTQRVDLVRPLMRYARRSEAAARACMVWSAEHRCRCLRVMRARGRMGASEAHGAK